MLALCFVILKNNKLFKKVIYSHCTKLENIEEYGFTLFLQFIVGHIKIHIKF